MRKLVKQKTVFAEDFGVEDAFSFEGFFEREETDEEFKERCEGEKIIIKWHRDLKI